MLCQDEAAVAAVAVVLAARLSVPARGAGWYRDRANESPLGPLSADERKALTDAAPMTPDTKRLFSALLARCSCRRPDGRWQVGQFLFANDENFNCLSGFARLREFELTGSGDCWQLTWSLPVAPETITRPLITPGIALPGAVVTVEKPAVASTVRFGLGRATADVLLTTPNGCGSAK